jgi:hypothetical protein
MVESKKRSKSFAITIQENLKDLCTLPPLEEAPDKYSDWGAKGFFKVKTAKGECAA